MDNEGRQPDAGSQTGLLDRIRQRLNAVGKVIRKGKPIANLRLETIIDLEQSEGGAVLDPVHLVQI